MAHSKHRRTEHTLIHNPGYDFRRLLNWISEADANNPDLPFAPYFLPVIGILAACCAIEGYVNMVGQKVDPSWAKFDKGPMPIRDRISRVYYCVGKKPLFSKGVWNKALSLFKMRNELVHPKYVQKAEKRKIKTIFQTANKKYPPSDSKRIAEGAIDTLLKDTNLQTLKNVYQISTYAGPPRARASR